MFALLLVAAIQTLEPLSDQQIKEAIELGRSGKVPIVQVGTFLGVTKGGFNVWIEGPIGRIAAASERAFRQYRPFDVKDVTDEMKAPLYRVIAERDERGGNRVAFVQHIVLQPKGAKGMDGVIQPVKEDRRLVGGARFDRLPDGEFDVVIATPSGAQKYNVSLKQRERIR
jgi:hypothetical protein